MVAIALVTRNISIMEVVSSVLVVVVATFLWVLCYWLPTRRLWEVASKIPGPPCVPVFGNALIFSGSMSKAFVNIKNLIAEYGTVTRIWVANKLFIFVNDPEDIEKILGNVNIRNRDKVVAGAAKYFLGEGLLTNADDTWKIHRKLINPLFHYKVVDVYFGTFVEKSEVLFKRLEKVADGTPFDIGSYLNLFTMDSICEAALGIPANAQDSEKNLIGDAIHEAERLTVSRLAKPWFLFDRIYFLTQEGKRSKQVKKLVRDYFQKVVDQKMAAYHSGIRKQGVVTSSGKKITSFLDMIIETSETQNSMLSALDIMDEVITIASAGFDTTSLTMSFFLIYVSIHPEIQQQIQNELDDIFEQNDGKIAIEDLPRLHFLDRALKETMRLIPAVCVLPRDIPVDVVLPSGYKVPKGSSVGVVPYMVHRNPKYYSQPERFWPDRWLAEHRAEHARPHPYAFIPFSAGPRNCVGQKYAMLQMKTALGLILRRFQVSTDYAMQDLDNLQWGITFILGDGKYMVKMVKR